MRSHYREWNHKKSQSLTGIASQLHAERHIETRLSPYIWMIDPGRVQDIAAHAQSLPAGAAVIYRHYGANDREDMAQRLRRISFDQGLQFLIGNDPELAIACGADGVHFRRDAALEKPALWRERCPDWIITMAGLKGRQDYTGNLNVLDGLIVSSIFESQSPSAGPAISAERLGEVCANLNVPIIALGGVNVKTARALIGSGAAGFAGVSGLVKT